MLQINLLVYSSDREQLQVLGLLVQGEAVDAVSSSPS